MSQITVGYTDKVRRAQPRGPAGGISDIFGFSNDSSYKKNENAQQQEKTQQNDQTDTKISEKTESLTIEENSNEVTKTVASSVVEIKETQTTTSEVTNNGSLNGNVRENGNTKQNGNMEKRSVNNIIHTKENDLATPQRKNRVPPGGYSSGLW